MSLSYWMIEGIGINVENVIPYVNKEKAARAILEQHPDDDELQEIILSGDYSSFDVEEYLYEVGFDNFADLLTHCDDTDSLTYSDDGDGNSYFYYPPSMPWHRVSNEPNSEDEVIDRIVAAVQKITDMTREKIVLKIDTELYVVGIG